MKALELRTMPLESLQAADYNPRTMTAKARARLKASLERFGLVEPLVWNERTGRVVGGHQRLGILRELGVRQVTVSVVNLDDIQEKALNVVLNNLETQGRYDTVKLREVLKELEPHDGLDASGFDHTTLKNLEFVPVLEEMPAENFNNVEITLSADGATFEQLSPRLDELVREFDLVSHVRRTAAPSAPACNATTAPGRNLP